ncbi:MAG: hypothetical protein ABI967_06345 [bacterium]
MRLRLPISVVVLALVSYVGVRSLNYVRIAASSSWPWTVQAASPPTSASTMSSANVSGPEKVDFARQVRPILDPKCQPCHFNGGKMYERMPFDRPETIKTLGAKLFTRIKDENERQIIRAFLAQE